jgi:hypothetical protein
VFSVISENGPGEALHFLNVLHPLLMEFLPLDGIDQCFQKIYYSKIVKVQNNLKGVKQHFRVCGQLFGPWIATYVRSRRGWFGHR